MRVEWGESGVLTITSRTGESIRVKEVVDIDKGNDNMTLKVERVSKDEAFDCLSEGLASIMEKHKASGGSGRMDISKDSVGLTLQRSCEYCNDHKEPCTLGCND